MPYNEKLADRVREALADIPGVEEKKMFRGVTFMVNDKMCVSVSRDELMLRLDPGLTEQLVEEPGTRPMVHGGKHMKGLIYNTLSVHAAALCQMRRLVSDSLSSYS